MKKTIHLIIVIALGVSTLFATNGSTLIGMGAKTRGMAGTGIGVSHCAESALINPALITCTDGSQVSFGGTLFMPDVKTDSGSGYKESQAKLFMIPTISITAKATDSLYIGMGIWGTAGMGVDYRDEQIQPALDNGNMRMVTNLMIMQFGLPIAYKINRLSIAVTPLVQYGALDMNYKDPTAILTSNANVGAGIAQDLVLGYNIGISYNYSALTIGAVYKSQIDMDYQDQMRAAMTPFLTMGVFTEGEICDELSTPAEMGVGISLHTGKHSFALDYKLIQWSKAKGYKEFNWADQNVFSAGYEYKRENFALRFGYNYAKSPVKDASSRESASIVPSAIFSGAALNTLNLLGFPATVESHYAIGGTFKISQTTAFDLALTYAPETVTTLSGLNTNSGFLPGDIATKHSQMAFTGQVSFNF